MNIVNESERGAIQSEQSRVDTNTETLSVAKRGRLEKYIKDNWRLSARQSPPSTDTVLQAASTTRVRRSTAKGKIVALIAAVYVLHSSHIFAVFIVFVSISIKDARQIEQVLSNRPREEENATGGAQVSDPPKRS